MLILNAFIAVALPSGFTSETNTNKLNMAIDELNNQADALLQEAKTSNIVLNHNYHNLKIKTILMTMII